MSYQRVQNVLYHAPAELTVAERLALVALADRTPGTDPERTVKFANDDFAQVLGIQARNIRQVTTRLADRHIELRVPVAKTKDGGDPVYAFRGSVPTYQVPWFPAPDGCLCSACAEGASVNAPLVSTEPEKARPSTRDTDPEGALTDAPSSPEGASSDAPKARKGRSSTQKGRSGTPPYQYQPTNQPTLDARTTPKTAAADSGTDSPTTPTPLPESLRLIVATLADEQITVDEARAVMRAFAAAAKPRGPGLYRTVAKDGGIQWRTILADLRTADKDAAAVAVAELRRQARCPHGEPGGDQLHPTYGTALCPLCRREVPAVQTPAGPDPVETYRQIHTATHGSPPLDLMTRVARQRLDLAERGASHGQLQTLAAAAAYHGHDLVTHLRTESDRASA